MEIFSFGKVNVAVSVKSFAEFVLEEKPMFSADILVLGFDTFVDMVVTESDNPFMRVAKLSKELDCLVLCGVLLENVGAMRVISVVCYRGQIVDLVERAVVCGQVAVYSSKKYRLALLIDSDVYSSKVLEKIVEVDFAISLLLENTLESEPTLGVDVLAVGLKGAKLVKATKKL